MNVLITGGAGFLGINLVRFLLAKGVGTIRTLDIASFDYPERELIEVVDGDIRHEDTVLRAMEGITHVVHAAAALPLYKEEDIRTTDVDGTRIVAEAALATGVRRMIHISSTAVYGIPDHHPLYETDRLQGVGVYGECKIEAEKICQAVRGKGLCIPIVRPKSFVGPERLGVFALLYDWARTGHGFPLIGNGKNRYQLLDVEDLCEAIWACMTLPDEQVDDVFNIGAEQFTTMREDWQAVLDVAGYGKKMRGFPAWPLVWGLRFLEVLHLSPLYKWVYETAGKDSFVSIDKAVARLGFAPKYSTSQALVRNYRWYLANLDKFEGSSGVSHRVPWKQGLLRFFKMFF